MTTLLRFLDISPHADEQGIGFCAWLISKNLNKAAVHIQLSNVNQTFNFTCRFELN